MKLTAAAPLVLAFAMASGSGTRAPEAAQPNDNRTPAGRLENGVLTLALEARAVDWYPEDPAGASVPAYAFAEPGKPATIPGPLIRVPLGTEVRVTIHNTLAKPLKLRGLFTREAGIRDSLVLAPGATEEVRFPADLAGTYFYWGRTEPVPTAPLVGRGRDASLIGALIVDPPGRPADPTERILVITMWMDSSAALGNKSEAADLVLSREFVRPDQWLLMAVNGRSWPRTERLSYAVGDTVRWRVINGAAFPHPMHLHGFHYTVTARGNAMRDTVYTVADQRTVVTEWMVLGTTMSMTWLPTRPGNWLFHCHLVTHISEHNRLPAPAGTAHGGHGNHGEQGMAGLVIGIRVAPRVGARPAAEPTARRRLRVFVTERAGVFGSDPGYGYVLQEGDRPPAADSIRGAGSTLVLRQDEPTEITVINRTRHATTVHWHGIELQSFYDGVGDWSGWGERVARAIAPGDSFVARMSPPRAGTYIYHTHVGEGHLLASGLYGALIVLPPAAPVADTGHVVLVGMAGVDANSRPLINGTDKPEPIVLQAGRPARLRLINISPLETHTIQLRLGEAVQQWRVLAKDGADLPAARATLRAATVALHPGETMDVELAAEPVSGLSVTVVSLAARAVVEEARAQGVPVAQLARILTPIPVVVR
jgi:FtsP/CotA-like multicopper oxidase with cupredoxin domain